MPKYGSCHVKVTSQEMAKTGSEVRKEKTGKDVLTVVVHTENEKSGKFVLYSGDVGVDQSGNVCPYLGIT